MAPGAAVRVTLRCGYLKAWCGIADVFDVREHPDLNGFDHIIIGGAIRMAVTSKELQDYIVSNKEWLKHKVRGLFAVCGNMRQPVDQQQTAQSSTTIWQNCVRSALFRRMCFSAE